MLNRNFDNVQTLAKLFYGGNEGTNTVLSNYGEGFLGVKATNGNLVGFGVWAAKFYGISSSLQRSSSYIPGNESCGYYYDSTSYYNLNVGGYLASGTPNQPAEETYEDFRMSSCLSSSAVTNPSVNQDPIIAYNSQTNCFERVTTKTYKAAQDIYINEIALTGYGNGTSGNPVSGAGVLYDRKVLSEPVFVQANKYFTINYKISIPACPNKPPVSEAVVETA